MARKIQSPITSQPDENGRIKVEHPAFAQIVAHRVSGRANLYGSDFQHHNYMSIKIAHSVLNRSLSTDWPHATINPYIEVNLSEAQWASFVSSVNVGRGTQCTMTYLMSEEIPGLPDPTSRKDQFKDEAATTMARAHAAIDSMIEEISSMKISQKAKDDLIKRAMHARNSIGSSVEFVLDMFGEHMEETVEKAKIEINAYATNTLMRAGLKSLEGAGPAIELAYAPTEPK